jgi:HMG box factor, other
MHSVRTDSSQTSPFHQQSPRRAPYPHAQQLQTHHEKDEDMDILFSPPSDQKRRRFNPEPQLKRGYPSPSPMSFSSPRPYTHNGLPIAAGNYKHQQHLGPDMLLRSGNTGYAQQESPAAHQPRHLYPSRSGAFDESLRLPPLQTQLSGPSQSATHRTDLRAENRDIHARSVSAMVMTIPYINKIKVLAKISPPLLPPSAASPAQQIRGAVIAVESADKILLSEIGAFINEHLARDDSCTVKTWTISRPSESISAPAGDTEMAGTEHTSNDPIPTENTAGNSFVEYLTIISEWHKKSQEIRKYITTMPDPPSADAASASQRAVAMSKVIPIALLPNGFSLTTSDTFASRIPINDSYAPVDHWQWMATLWRGIVGPDLTVYVKRVDREEMERHGGVEIRGDCGGIVVRVAERAKLDEKTARRLGFEVIEFVRGVEAGLDCRMD